MPASNSSAALIVAAVASKAIAAWSRDLGHGDGEVPAVTAPVSVMSALRW